MASIYVRASDEMEDDRLAGDDYLMDAQYFDQMAPWNVSPGPGGARVGRRRPLHLHRVSVCAAARRPSAGPGNQQQRLQAAEKQRGGRSISLYPCGGRPVQLQVDARVRREIDRGGRRPYAPCLQRSDSNHWVRMALM